MFGHHNLILNYVVIVNTYSLTAVGMLNKNKIPIQKLKQFKTNSPVTFIFPV